MSREDYEAEGERAYYEGRGREHCPYSDNQYAREAWLDGWAFAWAMDD